MVKKSTRKPGSSKSKAGRPGVYVESMNERARKLCLLGLKDKELANAFGVSEVTLNAWKKKYPAFLKSINAGKENADAEIANSLYQRAKGYSHPEDKIFNNDGEPLIVPTIKHYPPDTAAAFIWLKNRQSANWRDKTEVEHTQDIIVHMDKLFEDA